MLSADANLMVRVLEDADFDENQQEDEDARKDEKKRPCNWEIVHGYTSFKVRPPTAAFSGPLTHCPWHLPAPATLFLLGYN